VTEEYRLRVFENRLLRKMFGPKRHEITREWRRVHKEEHCHLYSPNVIRVIKPRRMRWGRGKWHVWGRRAVHTGFSLGDMREREELGLDGMIISK
jgi:hypothetical protein